MLDSKNTINLIMSRSITRIALRVFFATIELTMYCKVICNNLLLLVLFTIIVNKPKAILRLD